VRERGGGERRRQRPDVFFAVRVKGERVKRERRRNRERAREGGKERHKSVFHRKFAVKFFLFYL
jgi:hypothetical protein